MHNLLDKCDKKIYALSITDYIYIKIGKHRCTLYQIYIPLTIQILAEKHYSQKIHKHHLQQLYERCFVTLVETSMQLGLATYKETIEFTVDKLPTILKKYETMVL